MVKIPSPELLKTLCKCQDCHLYETAKNPYVPGRWVDPDNHPEVPLLICIGEANGRVEDEVGACFQHTSLKNLQKALGDNLNKCYLTNVCHCVPWGDPINKRVRKPTPIEMESCLPWLKLEISKFPEGTPIVAMGATAFQALMPSLANSRITEIAGREFDLVIYDKHYRLFAQVHPASIGYNPSLSEVFYGVFNKILKSLDQPIVDNESEYWKVLDPSQAIQKLNETKQLYLDKVIKYVVTDTETSGFIPWQDRVIMFGLAHTHDKPGYSIPIEIQNRIDFPDFPTDLYQVDLKISDHDIQLIKKASREMFDVVPIVGHNLKFDLKMMAYHNYLNLEKIKVYNDTLLMSAILIGRGWNGESLGLKEMCVKLLGLDEGWDWIVDQWIAKYKRIADRTYANIPTCILGKYCALDHYYTRELHEYLLPLVDKHNCRLLINTFNVATKAYSEAELKGIEIDWDIYDLIKSDSDRNLERIITDIKKDPHIKAMMLEKYNTELEENSKKKKPKDPGFFKNKLDSKEYFSLGSVNDRRELLYKRYGIKVFNTTDKGEPSCDKKTLQTIAENTENNRLKVLCENFLEYNKFSKLKSTYIDNLPEQCDQNKIYHPEFNIAGTVTGRLSSGFHTLPKKCLSGDTKIRLLNGESKEIKDIDPKQDKWVYSYDISSNTVIPGKILRCAKTDSNRILYRVFLNNGDYIDCTDNHPFLLEDNSYVEAKNLTVENKLRSIDGTILRYSECRIVSIGQLEGTHDVYDLEIEKYHNFLLDAGVFVHNSSIKHLYTSRDHKDSGSLWLSPDMSQLELRVTAGIANEPSWRNAYLNGEDLHQRTAASMFNVPFEEVTKDQRKIGKCVTGETIIETDHGPMRIDEIVPKDSPNDEIVDYHSDVKILTVDGYRDIKQVYRMEDAEICEVETEDGYTVRGTLHHEFVVGFNEDGSPILKKAINLTEEDYVYVLDEEE